MRKRTDQPTSEPSPAPDTSRRPACTCDNTSRGGHIEDTSAAGITRQTWHHCPACR